ncbi:MAG: polysaccharide deacetylase family protein [Fusobacteriaceae bacterium]|nr:polysaccharide deacetylase family protein [Fusobacteriaceae bacterium]
MKKEVYLTIDDGPSKSFKEKVDFLYENNIFAIFFCIGKKLKDREEETIYAINKGFTISNHSFEHKHFSNICLEECLLSIKKTDEIIESIYKKSNCRNDNKYFRFPYFDCGGDSSGEEYEKKWKMTQEKWSEYRKKEKMLRIQEYLKILGYKQPEFKGLNNSFYEEFYLKKRIDVGCTFDQKEYYYKRSNAPQGLSEELTILGRIDENKPNEGKSLSCSDKIDIILIHDDEKTMDIFYKCIKRYIEKGFTFLKV